MSDQNSLNSPLRPSNRDLPETPRRSHPRETIWHAVREALRGSRRDYTQGPDRPIDPHPRHSHGARDGDGERLRRLRRLLRRQARRRRRRDGRTHRVAAAPSSTRWRWGLAIGVTATVARRTGEKDPDGAARTAVQGIALGTRRRDGARRRRRHARAAAARASMGASPERRRDRRHVHARDARRQREHPAALSDQRHLPRRGRRRDRDAHALAGERDQHRARTVPDLRARTVSAAGRRPARRSRRPWGGASACCSLRRSSCAATAASSSIAITCGSTSSLMAAAGQAVGDGHVPDAHRHGELDRPGAPDRDVRQRRAGRLHDRDARS